MVSTNPYPPNLSFPVHFVTTSLVWSSCWPLFSFTFYCGYDSVSPHQIFNSIFYFGSCLLSLHSLIFLLLHLVFAVRSFPIHYILFSAHCCMHISFHLYSYFLKLPHSVSGMCFHLFLDFLLICFRQYDLTAIWAPLPPMPFSYVLLDSFTPPSHASWSLCSTSTFPLHYPLALRERARSHTLRSFANPLFCTDACTCFNADISYGGTVLSPMNLVVIPHRGFPALMLGEEWFSGCSHCRSLDICLHLS